MKLLREMIRKEIKESESSKRTDERYAQMIYQKSKKYGKGETK
jgi:hypothetical protein